MSCLNILNEVIEKKKIEHLILDVLLKWGGKIDKVTFWSAKN